MVYLSYATLSVVNHLNPSLMTSSWKQFPRYRPFVRGIHRSLVNSPHKGQWRGALMFSLICARKKKSRVNNGEAGDLGRNRAYYDVTVMQWIQTGVTVWNRSIRGKLGDFFLSVWLLSVWLKFDGQPWKTVGHLLYATSSFLHHFVAINEFKLELRSGNTQIGAKFVLTSVTLNFDLWSAPFVWTSLLSMVFTPEDFIIIG